MQNMDLVRAARWTSVGAVFGVITMPVLGATPPALDHVPTDAAIVFAVSDLDNFVSGMRASAQSVGGGHMAQAEAMMPMIEMFLDSPGVNADGSGAMIVYPPDPGGMGGDEMAVVLPVSSYADFASSFGGAGTGVSMLTIGEEEVYAKSLPGGFALLGSSEDVTNGFASDGGNLAAHTKMLGQAGAVTTSNSDGVVIANIDVLRPMIQEGLEEMKQNAAMYAAMSGQDMGAQIDMGMQIISNMVRDAQVGLIGVDFGDDGVSFDMTVQFKEGSEVAGFMSAAGDPTSLLSRVPTVDFLFAGAADLSSPAMQRIAGAYSEMVKSMAGEEAGFSAMQMLSESDGFASVLGKTRALTGGMLANNISYMRTKGGVDFSDVMSGAMSELDGQSMAGMLYSTEYQKGAAEIAGHQVDTYAVSTQPDPAAPPSGMGMGPNPAMIQAMLFGPTGGPRGYVAKLDGAVVQTTSRNTPLMGQAIEAAKSGEGLGTSAGVQQVASKLPEGRAFEVYIGVDHIMSTVGPMMAMMGMGGDIPVPPEMVPIGIGGSMNGGGMVIRAFLPNDVLKLAGSLAGDAPMPNDAPDF